VLATEGVIINKKGVRVGFLAYSAIVSTGSIATLKMPGVAPAWPEKRLGGDIKRLKSNADIVFVSFHWGEERSYRPSKHQTYLAKYAIDSGADIVAGHHPHVLQGIQIYMGKPVVYSLGNFVFMPPKDEQNETVLVEFMVRVHMTRGADGAEGDERRTGDVSANIESVIVRPGYIHSGQPRLASGDRAKKILTMLRDLCNELKTKLVVDEQYKYARIDVGDEEAPAK